MTTTTTSAFEVIKERLPSNVIHQFAPLDIPSSMDAFLQYWRPNAVMLMESELWPNLIMGAARNGIALALLNGRMSTKSFQNWSHPVILPLIKLMLSKFSLILPLSTIQGIQFQLLQAPPHIIRYSGDLKCAIADYGILLGVKKSLVEFQAQLSHRKVWMASSIHKGEEEGELRDFYSLTPIAVVGGSFLPESAGHNILEAAAAGCAVFTGHHVGHFSHMIAEMQRVNPLSVLQVSSEKLVEVVNELFINAKILETRRVAAKQAYHALSCGVVEKLWETVHFHVFMKLVGTDDAHGARS